MNQTTQYKIGIMGSAKRSGQIPEVLQQNAEIIGKEIARHNCILVTGACMGVPDIASQSASKAGGLVFGFSPAKNLKEHIEPPISYPYPSKNMKLIFTGYGKIGRNVLSIVECDGVIFIGGGIGTLNEFTIAYHEGKVIGILEGIESITEKALKLEQDFRYTGASLIMNRNPKTLVKKVIEEIKEREQKPRKETPITFKNERGKELTGILHIPEIKKPPAVIITHGFQSTKTGTRYIKLSRALAEKGILVFRFDFEGCGDSEGNPRDITIEREISDLNSAVNALFKNCDVDSSRMGFVGESLGSIITALFIQKSKENPKINPKALVFWSQAFNQKKLLKHWYSLKDLKEIKEKGVLITGEKEIGKDYYLENKNKDYSSILSKIKLPILIIHGKKDEDVPLEFSQKLVEKYKNIVLKIIPGANHKFNDFYSQQKLIVLTANWFKKYL